MGAATQTVSQRVRPALYNALLLSGKLNAYLTGIDQQAQELMDTIIQQMAEAQEITETMKATDQMAWIGKMNKYSSQCDGSCR